MMQWDEPLPPDERERLLNEVAAAVAKRGLQTPALFALEMHRPLAFTLSQSLIVFGPLFAPLIGVERMERAARLLREEGAIDALIERIERTQPPQQQPSVPAGAGGGN